MQEKYQKINTSLMLFNSFIAFLVDIWPYEGQFWFHPQTPATKANFDLIILEFLFQFVLNNYFNDELNNIYSLVYSYK